MEFVDLINFNEYNLKLTLNYHPSVVKFLDLPIYVDSNQ